MTRSSIDANPGDGDPERGDKEGGINLGFVWSDPVESDGSWSISIGNELATHDMTVDVTPRRTQRFHPAGGKQVHWQSSTGSSGTAVADDLGIVTVPALLIHPGQRTTLTITQ